MQEKKQILDNKLSGKGIYIYENFRDSEFMLPRPTHKGLRTVPAKTQFEGDSHYLSLVETREIKLIKIIKSIEQVEAEERDKLNPTVKEEVMEKKLILDQPDIVTTKGTIEHVVEDTVAPEKKKPLNDSTVKENTKKSKSKLLTEDPISQIEVIN